jgi:diguanylate cyclase (GGDEF)-like protein/PAS domain S-box-containing protein
MGRPRFRKPKARGKASARPPRGAAVTTKPADWAGAGLARGGDLELLYRDTFDQAAVGIVHNGLDGRYIRVNRKFCEMVGYSAKELIGRNADLITHPDDLARSRANRRLLQEGTESIQAGEKRYIRKDGKMIWVRRTASLARDETGKPMYVIRVIEDITDRKEAEERYRAAFDNAPVGILYTSIADDRILNVNPKLCEMTGYGREELCVMATDDLIPPDFSGVDRPKYRESMLKGEIGTYSSERKFLRKDGSSFWINRTVSLARDASGEPLYFIRIVEDISERKEFERQFRATFDQAAVGIVHTALDGRYLRVNRKLCEISGYTEEELTGERQARLSHPDDLESGGQQRARLLSGKIESHSNEKRYVRKDGAVIWVNRTESVARDAAGQAIYFIRIIEDISSRKELEQRYRDSFDQVAVGIVHTSEDGCYLRVNQKFCEMLGYPASELIGRQANEFTHPDDREKSREGRQRLWRGEIDKVVEEKRYIRKDGSAIWTNRTVSMARDALGKPLYFIRVIEDITERKAAEERYRATFENAPVGIMHTSLEGYRILRANRKLCEMLGYSHEELLGMTSTSVVHPDYRFSDRAHYGAQLLRGEIPSFASERVFVRKDGSSLWVNRTVSLVRDAAGEPEYHIRVIEDISKRKEAEDAVARERSLLRTVVDALPDRIYAKDSAGYFLLQNATNVKAHGAKSAEELLGRTVYDIFPPEVAKRVDAEDRAIIESGDPVLNRERSAADASGKVRWMVSSKVPFRDPDGHVIGIVGVSRDITEYKRMEEALRQNVERFETLAHYDVLTGLPNRVLFYDRLKQSLAHARRNQWNVGVMFIDVDRFKYVNDTLGHAVGDKLLKQVSERLTRAVRADDTVGRLGGDEFAIVLSNLTSVQDANPVAQKLMASFNEPFRLEGSEVFVTGSIGITLFPDDSTDQDTLIKNADAAMYRAKELGRNGYQFYTPEMNARALELLSMESSLRRALERGEFLLHYQPKANVANGEIVGTEALMRWNHPERGMVPPSAFIPVMEETGLIVPAGEWVLGAVCRQIHAWKEAGIVPMPVAVNLSARQFLAKDLGPTIKRILEEHGVDPALIELEITESSLMSNTQEAIRTLEYLNGLGLSISIDDFGTGYSSLAYLKRFPLDALKIDRSFVRDITTEADDANITRAIISMAHSLQLKVIAEGVETEAQATFLADHGCDEIQGYFLTPPLPAQEYLAWLAGRGVPGRPLAARDTRPAVLLVDDEEIALVLARRALGKDGYRVHTAKNAHDAFKLLGEHRVDVVISDHHMPGTSGIEFLARVKSQFPHVMRIMLSGNPDPLTAREAAERAGVFRFLPKGVSDELLRAEVCEALRVRGISRDAVAGSAAAASS